MNTTELVVEIRPSMNYLKYNGLSREGREWNCQFVDKPCQ